jgi:hypothetical protein
VKVSPFEPLGLCIVSNHENLMFSTIDIAEIGSKIARADYQILRNPQTIELATSARAEYFGPFNGYIKHGVLDEAPPARRRCS